ncbi:MAG: SMC family ATPase, partial [Flavobacteriaceae bacterium]|nr:SMC family ATPase [Flavobacteriaceae bacterium]
NLDLPTLETKRDDLKSQLEQLAKDYETKEDKIEEYTTLLTELSESIENRKTINDTPIEDAKKEYDIALNSKKNTGHYIALLEQSIESNQRKISHLDNHKYDPNCKFCCDNVFVKDAMKAKEDIVSQTKEMETLNIAYDALLQQIGNFGEIETHWEEYNDLKTKWSKGNVIKEKTQAELSGLETKEELLQTQLDKVEEDIERYFENEETIQSNKELEKQIKDLEIEKKKIESEIKDISKQIATINGSISSLQTYIDTIKQKMSDVKELEEKNRLYSYYLDAVKRDGIPYELITKALPVIESEINNILGQVVDFGITMEMDGKSINAKIVYEDQEWPLEMCSGMEKFVSGLAIRVALINVCNLPRPNFLVVDEGFGTLDADNLSSLFMMMQYLKTQFDFIWMISHLEQMRDIVDGLIEIKKENGFSKIDF